jgi:hypothetical protein
MAAHLGFPQLPRFSSPYPKRLQTDGNLPRSAQRGRTFRGFPRAA